jgi:hypothetical protein
MQAEAAIAKLGANRAKDNSLVVKGQKASKAQLQSESEDEEDDEEVRSKLYRDVRDWLCVGCAD